jgi:hypothetical protein
MYTANRYLVVWESAATGQHQETKPSQNAAEALLDEKRDREHFVRGAVIDMSGYTMSEERFLDAHRSAV